MRSQSFIELNRQKLRFAFVFSSLLFLCLTILIAVFGMLVDEDFKPEEFVFEDLVWIALISGVFFPLFILFLARMVWGLRRKAFEKKRRREPFNQLEKIGFKHQLVFENSKWNFTEETLYAQINSFDIRFTVGRDFYESAEFVAFVKQRNIEKDEFKDLKEELGKDSIYFSINCFVKFYRIKRKTTLTLPQLQEDLLRYTNTLKVKGFEPGEVFDF